MLHLLAMCVRTFYQSTASLCLCGRSFVELDGIQVSFKSVLKKQADLETELQAKADTLAALITNSAAEAARSLEEATAKLSETVAANDQLRVSSDSVNAAAITQLSGTVSANDQLRISGDSANAAAITQLSNMVAANDQLRVSGDSATAAAITQLSGTVSANDQLRISADSANAAAITQLSNMVAANDQLRVSGDSANAAAITQLSGTVSANDQLRINGDSANAAEVSKLKSTLSDSIIVQMSDLAAAIAATEVCGDAGQVKNSEGKCISINVDLPLCSLPTIANAVSYISALKLTGETVPRTLLSCPVGYFVDGPAEATCKDTGEWSNLPYCTKCSSGCVKCTSATSCQKCQPGKEQPTASILLRNN